MDLTFKVSDKEKFNVRCAAMIRCNDFYLVSKREDKDYYSLPGGRINFKEDSKTGILRELNEELDYNIAPSDAKLVRMIENFFSFKDETFFHEYLFVYLIDVSEEYLEKGNFINLENTHMHMEWYSTSDFKKLAIRPDELKDILDDDTFKHLIIKK